MASKKRQLQLLFTVRDIEPPIWRRIVVDGSATLVKLHKAIQILMDWDDYHLHEFRIGEDRYAPPSEDDDDFDVKPKSPRKKLSAAFPTVGSSIEYSYDFGDGWEIDIVLEDEREVDGDIPVVTCIGGKRAGPLEDSGGPFGYMEKVEILSDPGHPQFRETVEWIPSGYSPEDMGMPFMNTELAKL